MKLKAVKRAVVGIQGITLHSLDEVKLLLEKKMRFSVFEMVSRSRDKNGTT